MNCEQHYRVFTTTMTLCDSTQLAKTLCHKHAISNSRVNPADVCCTTGEGHKAAKLRVKQQKIAGVAKVIGISKLKGKYEPFEAKRQLCNSYDLFVADDRVIPSLPKLIGMHTCMSGYDHFCDAPCSVF